MPPGVKLVMQPVDDVAPPAGEESGTDTGEADTPGSTPNASPASASAPEVYAAPGAPEGEQVAQAAPVGVARMIATVSHALPVAGAQKRLASPWGGQIPAQAEEALAVIAAVLAVVCASLSLVGILHRWMLVFAAPALILAVWSLQHQKPTTPPEITKIAQGTLIATLAWAVIRFVFWLLLHR